MKKKICRAAAMAAALIFMTSCGTQAADYMGEEKEEEMISAAETELEEMFLSAEEDEAEPVVMQEYSETDEYPELAAFLIEYYQIPEEYQTSMRYYYNYTDLNEDGTEEIFALVVGECTSKNTGECAVILEPKAEGGFEVINAFENMHTPVTVCNEMQNGWHKIIYEVYGGGQDAGSVICHYEEDGGYTTDANEFVEKMEPVVGIQILSNNLIDDMDQGNYITLVPNTEE